MPDLLKQTTRSISEFLFGSGSKKQLVQIKKLTPLQSYFDKAYKDALDGGKFGVVPATEAEKKKRHVPISIIAHVSSGNVHETAGIHQDEMHFSASLLKVGPMVAAFKLLADAKALAKTPPAGGFSNQAAFFAALKQKFQSSEADSQITSAGPTVGLEPRYTDILEVTGFGGVGPLTVKFVPIFYRSLLEDRALYDAYEQVRTQDGLGEDADGNPIENARSLAALAKVSHMYRMIVISSNTSAGECIRRLGYAYINAKLKDAQLFHPATATVPKKGIWVGGDFAGGTRVEVDSVNDDKVALATTTRDIASLFSLVQLGKLIDADSSAGMKELLQEAQRIEPSWVSRGSAPRSFTVNSVKIGVSNLKPNTPPKGPNVYSEGIIVIWNGSLAGPTDKNPSDRNLSGEFAVCWQNLQSDTIPTKAEGIADVIQNSIQNYLNQS